MHGRCLRAVGEGGEKGWLVVDFVWLECTAEGSQRLLWYLAAGSPWCRLKLLSEYHASLWLKNLPDHKVTVIMRRWRQGKLLQWDVDSNVTHIYLRGLEGEGGYLIFCRATRSRGHIQLNKQDECRILLLVLNAKSWSLVWCERKDCPGGFDHLKFSFLPHPLTYVISSLSNMYVMGLWRELTHTAPWEKAHL